MPTDLLEIGKYDFEDGTDEDVDGLGKIAESSHYVNLPDEAVYHPDIPGESRRTTSNANNGGQRPSLVHPGTREATANTRSPT